jgi:hypothetical protein
MAETLDELKALKAAFESWRSKKRHPREPVPDELLEQARRAMRIHGPGPVAQATKVERARLMGGRAAGLVKRNKGRKARAAVVPSYSRVEVVAPVPSANRPFAEIETPSGLKLRIFAQTHEALGLLSSLFGSGGTR